LIRSVERETGLGLHSPDLLARRSGAEVRGMGFEPLPGGGIGLASLARLRSAQSSERESPSVEMLGFSLSPCRAGSSGARKSDAHELLNGQSNGLTSPVGLTTLCPSAGKSMKYF
jgi:hypothetical protein